MSVLDEMSCKSGLGPATTQGSLPPLPEQGSEQGAEGSEQASEQGALVLRWCCVEFQSASPREVTRIRLAIEGAALVLRRAPDRKPS